MTAALQGIVSAPVLGTRHPAAQLGVSPPPPLPALLLSPLLPPPAPLPAALLLPRVTLPAPVIHHSTCRHTRPQLVQVGDSYSPDQLTQQLGAALGLVGLTSDGTNSGGGSGGGSAGVAAGGDWPGGGSGSRSPWCWDVTVQLLACLAWQAVLYGGAVLLLETGALPRLWERIQGTAVRSGSAALGARGGVGGRGAGYEGLPAGETHAAAAAAGAAAAVAEGGEGEDEDVAAERQAVQSGRRAADATPVRLRGVSKTYWQAQQVQAQAQQQQQQLVGGVAGGDSSGAASSPGSSAGGGAVRAVQDLWLGIGTPLRREQRAQPVGGSNSDGGGGGSGECFGLLGVNGAGKTTTFRMITGTCGTGVAVPCFCAALLYRPARCLSLHCGTSVRGN